MKILHVPFCYYPDPVGGTEVYVEALSRALTAHGVSPVIAVGADRDQLMEHDSIPVYRFTEPALTDIRTLYGGASDGREESFFRIVDQERPDVVHLHASTRLTSARAVQALHRRGIPVVFTYHLPTATCQRGTLVRWGRDICDGRLDASLCTRCTVHALGAPRPVAEVVGRIPTAVGHAIGSAGRTGNVWTTLRMRELVELRLKTTSGFLSEVDRIVVPAEWARDVLLVNNVDPAKIVLSRHGIDGTAPSNDPAAPAPPPLRLAFLGRIGPSKGADILIDAIRLLPDAPVELDLYGIVQDANAGKSWDDLMRSAQGDARIRFHRPVSPAEVIALLTRYHLLAVPSRWLETGPLVVLEAFAAGTPVLGMDRGGIAELVHDGSNGLLVGSEAPEAWRDAILRVLEHPELLERLQAGVRAPRTMDQVAAEMSALYQGLQLNATVVP